MVGHPVQLAKGKLFQEKQRPPAGHATARPCHLFEVTRRAGEEQHERHLVTGSTLRALLDISTPTLWRWRKTPGFPKAMTINNRNYFVWAEILVWLDDRAGQSIGRQNQ